MISTWPLLTKPASRSRKAGWCSSNQSNSGPVKWSTVLTAGKRSSTSTHSAIAASWSPPTDPVSSGSRASANRVRFHCMTAGCWPNA